VSWEIARGGSTHPKLWNIAGSSTGL
jgi:hypothetical protein